MNDESPTSKAKTQTWDTESIGALETEQPRQIGGPRDPKLNYQAFLRDLPRLLEANLGKWVAYRDGKQLGIRTSRRHYYRELLDAGYSVDDIEIFAIEPLVSWDSDDPVVE